MGGGWISESSAPGDMGGGQERRGDLYALPTATGPPGPIGFPAMLPPLVGRVPEKASLREALLRPGQRLITLTGPGGVGKTRLAQAAAIDAAAEFADGTVFVPLAAVTDPALALPTIARALDVRDSPGRPLTESLAAALAGRQLLLVLDNLEHLLPATSDIAGLLDACPGLTVLATSRAPLRLTAEQRFPTPPLALPDPRAPHDPDTLAAVDAIALFVERSRRVRPEFALDAGNAAAVAAVCRGLDGLPLAIELAAAWMHVLSPAALLARIEHRLPLLTGGGADQPARLRSMRDAIAWSHDLLTEDERRLFRRLGIFVGGFTLDAADAVGGRGAGVGGTAERTTSDFRLPTSDSAFELLAALVEKSLVQPIALDGGEPRFAMLETVREFALEALVTSGEHEAAEAARAGFILDVAEAAEPHLFGPEERRWIEAIDAELANVRGALAWTIDRDVETGLRTAAALWIYWAWRVQLAEGRGWLARLLERGDAAGPVTRCRALTTAAALAMLGGDDASAETLVGEALGLAMDTGDRLSEARAYLVAGSVPLQRNDPERAGLLFDRSIERFSTATSTTDKSWAAYGRAYRGLTAFVLGDASAAVSHYENALAQARATGGTIVTLLILGDFGGLLLETGDTARARRLTTEALAMASDIGEVWPAGHALCVLAATHSLDGALVESARYIGAGQRLLRIAGMTLAPPLQNRIDRTAARAREGLGPEAYAAAYEAGWANPASIIAEATGAAIVPTQSASVPDPDAITLTTREHDVLRLLADGQSDKQIADALFISRKTASNHVASILAKLGVENRAAAAAHAMRDGLV